MDGLRGLVVGCGDGFFCVSDIDLVRMVGMGDVSVG